MDRRLPHLFGGPLFGGLRGRAARARGARRRPPWDEPATASPTAGAGPGGEPAAGPAVEPPSPAEAGPISALEPPAVYRALGTSPAGLSSVEAAARLAEYGPNELPRPVRRPLVLRFADQLTHFMALLLWIGGLLAFLSRTPELGWAIWAVIVINGAFSFWQEYRAERALDELGRMLPPLVRVRRDGELRVLPARELVPGDVIELEEGDRVPADARLTWSALLSVDISVLTGESTPQPRRADALPEGTNGRPGEASNLVLGGTTVATGRARAVVYATGAATEFGRVAHLTATVERERSTLEVQVARIARVISALALGWGVAVFVLTYVLVGIELDESFIFAIGIIVANIPEGLLPTVTLSLAITVQRMARRNALVRRLSAVETLSAISVICTDKTGTLTKNEMTVTELWTRPAVASISGAGYRLAGELHTSAAGERLRPLRLLLAGAALCSNARLQPVGAPGGGQGGVPGGGQGGTRGRVPGEVTVLGDPTEGALCVAAAKAGLGLEALRDGAPRRREVPFDARRRMMSVVLRWHLPDLWLTGAPYLVFAKGAPTEILARCASILGEGEVLALDEAERATVLAANDALAGRGLRVLGVAMREGGSRLLDLDPTQLETGLTFIGLVAMHDPPRPEAAAAIAACRAAGIRVTMVTGDDGHTAAAIGRQIGLVPADDEATVITGPRLDQLPEAALRELLRHGQGLIFARASPEQKLRLVRAYQELGHLVAVTGDGVNDAPALRAANIGIAMGISGTDVAREAADIVLLDDNFATIVRAVEHGRAIYQNIRKFATYILTSNVPEMAPFVAMVGLKVPPGLNVMQILSVDLGTDMVPALALGAEPPEAGLMAQSPRPKGSALIDLPMLLRSYAFLGLIEALVSLVAFFAVWWRHGYGLADLQALTPALLTHTADPVTTAVLAEATTACLAGIVACQVGNVFASRSESQSAFRLGFFSNRLIWLGIATEVAFLLVIAYWPPAQAVIHSAPLDPVFLVLLFAVAPLAVLIPEEIRKRLKPRLQGRSLLIAHA